MIHHESIINRSCVLFTNQDTQAQVAKLSNHHKHSKFFLYINRPILRELSA